MQGPSALAPVPSCTAWHGALECENSPSSPKMAAGSPGSGAPVQMVQRADGCACSFQSPERGPGRESGEGAPI